MYSVRQQYTLAGDVADFNKTAFVYALAAVASVDPEAISVTVVPASISVVADIRAGTNSAASDAIVASLQALAASGTAAAGAALGGVTLELIVMPVPVVDVQSRPPSMPSPTDPSKQMPSPPASPPALLGSVCLLQKWMGLLNASDECTWFVPALALVGGAVLVLACTTLFVRCFLCKPSPEEHYDSSVEEPEPRAQDPEEAWWLQGVETNHPHRTGADVPDHLLNRTGYGSVYRQDGIHISLDGAAGQSMPLDFGGAAASKPPPPPRAPPPAHARPPPPTQPPPPASSGRRAFASSKMPQVEVNIGCSAMDDLHPESQQSRPAWDGSAAAKPTPKGVAEMASATEVESAMREYRGDATAMRAEHKRIKAQLREYEIAFETQHGHRPTKKKHWQPVITDYERYAVLREAERQASALPASQGQTPQGIVMTARPPVTPATEAPVASSGWLDSSQVCAKWKALKVAADSKQGQMPAAEFADASLAIISVFDLISGMGVPASDMKGNANTIAKIARQSTPSATVNQLILAEIGGRDAKAVAKLADDGKTMCCAVLWLCRALLFVKTMISLLSSDRTLKLRDCVNKGYEAGLKQHHGMLIRGTFSIAVNAAPSREVFIAKLDSSEDAALAKIADLLPDFEVLLATTRAFLKENGIDKSQ